MTCLIISPGEQKANTSVMSIAFRCAKSSKTQRAKETNYVHKFDQLLLYHLLHKNGVLVHFYESVFVERQMILHVNFKEMFWDKV